MTWRMQVPVFSPVPARGIACGMAAALGLADARRAVLQQRLGARYSADEVVLTDSGTSALVMAMRMSAGAGGVVALPGYACIDLTAAAVRAGVRVRLYDLDPATLSPDLESVRAALERGVQVVVVAHLYGYPVDFAAVHMLAREWGVTVIEDAAQAAGGRLAGHRLGGFGELSVLSFGRGKGITAGSGGALLLRGPESGERAASLTASRRGPRRGGRELVTLAAQSVLARPSLYGLPARVPSLRLGEMVYHPASEPGDMSRVAAAMLPAALDAADAETRARRARAQAMMRQLAGCWQVRPVVTVQDGESGYLRLAVLDAGGKATPRPSLGVLRGYPLTLAQHRELQPVLVPGERAGSGSETLRDGLFTIPTHSRVGLPPHELMRGWLGALHAHDAVVPQLAEAPTA